MTIDDLIAIEEIKQMKARYFRFVDTKNYTEFRKLFANKDFCAVVGGDGMPRYEFKSADELLASTIDTTQHAEIIVHLAVAPEITITGPDTAKGIWTINDIVKTPEHSFEGHLHYFEEYRKEDGIWKVARIEYKKRAHFALDREIIPVED